MNKEVIRVTYDELDASIRAEFRDEVFMWVYRRYNRTHVSMEEFQVVLEDGLRDVLVSMITEFYDFLGEIEIQISDAIYYEKLVA